jgi:hypothetical protein
MSIGTTAPFFLADTTQSGQPILLGQDYFRIKIHSAQVWFPKQWFSRPKSLLVTSKVQVNSATLGNDAIRSLQHTRQIQAGQTVQLGLHKNLVSLVPATMSQVSIGVDFVVTLANHLPALASVINDDSFLAVIGLAPGAVTTAKVLSGLAKKLTDTFIQATDEVQTLSLNADFNLVASAGESGLRAGYYAVIASNDADHPLPTSAEQLSVQNQQLFWQNEPLREYSYVLLEVTRQAARTREANDSAEWEKKFVAAETVADNYLSLYQPSVADLKTAWEKCVAYLSEGRTLLFLDSNYLRKEAQAIYASAFELCRTKITQSDSLAITRLMGDGSKGLNDPFDLPEIRAALELPSAAATKDLLADYAALWEEVRSQAE